MPARRFDPGRSRGFINDSTGRLVREGELAAQLADLAARSHEHAPRRWAAEGGSPGPLALLAL